MCKCRTKKRTRQYCRVNLCPKCQWQTVTTVSPQNYVSYVDDEAKPFALRLQRQQANRRAIEKGGKSPVWQSCNDSQYHVRIPKGFRMAINHCAGPRPLLRWRKRGWSVQAQLLLEKNMKRMPNRLDTRINPPGHYCNFYMAPLELIDTVKSGVSLTEWS